MRRLLLFLVIGSCMFSSIIAQTYQYSENTNGTYKVNISFFLNETSVFTSVDVFEIDIAGYNNGFNCYDQSLVNYFVDNNIVCAGLQDLVCACNVTYLNQCYAAKNGYETSWENCNNHPIEYFVDELPPGFTGEFYLKYTYEENGIAFDELVILNISTPIFSPISYIIEDTEGKQREEVCVDIKVVNFENITGYQFEVEWDTSIIKYERVQSVEFLSPNEDSASIGKLNFMSSFLVPETLPDSSVFIEICFTSIGKVGEVSTVDMSLDDEDIIIEKGSVEIIIPDDGFSNHEIKAIARSGDPNGLLNLPLNGPYCPGETVSFCYGVDYYSAITGNQWMQGIVPLLGNGWDKSSFTGNVNMPAPGDRWDWYEEATVNYNVYNGNICSFINSNGVLDLCHSSYENCPCNLGMESESPLPAGWFYYFPGNGTQCENTGHPNSGWGYEPIQESNIRFEVCFDIKVRDYISQEDCIGEGDLSLSFFTFTDAEVGCFGEIVNIGSLPYFEEYLSECNGFVEIDAEVDIEICSNENVFIPLKALAQNAGIEYKVINEPNYVIGYTDGFSNSNMTFINQSLNNISGVPQEVIYQVNAIVPGVNCPGPPLFITVIVYPELDYNFISTDISCFGEMDGSIQFFSNIFSTIEVYYNNDLIAVYSQNFIEIDDLSAGDYLVNLYSFDYCLFQDEINISQPDEIKIVTTTTSIACDSEGQIAINVTGGVEPYLSQWDHGLGDNLFEVIIEEAGTYCVTLTDANGCVDVKCVDMTAEPTKIELNIIEHEITCFDAEDGRLSVEAFGGCPPFEYIWNTGSTSDSTANLKSGLYSVTITDAFNQSMDTSVWLDSPEELSIDIIENMELDILELVISGGKMPYNYFWSTGETSSLIEIQAEVEEYSVSITDQNGCMKEQEIFIEQDDQCTSVYQGLEISHDEVCLNQSGILVIPIYSIDDIQHDFSIKLLGYEGELWQELPDNFGFYLEVPSDIQEGNYDVLFQDDFTYNNINCAISDTIKLHIKSNFAPDPFRINLYSGNIMTADIDIKDYCLRWGYNEVNELNEFSEDIFIISQNKGDEMHLSEDGQTLYAGENNKWLEEIHESDNRNPPAYFWAEIWDRDPDGSCVMNDDDCVTRTYYNAMGVPPIKYRSTKDENTSKLFPNPNNGVFELMVSGSWTGLYDIEFFNTQGQLINSQSFEKTKTNHKETIDLNNTSDQGLVFIKLRNELGEITSYRVMIVK